MEEIKLPDHWSSREILAIQPWDRSHARRYAEAYAREYGRQCAEATARECIALLPGGNYADPQQIADAIRERFGIVETECEQ
ncbi:hypothetical protein [Caldimonas brevitalea]|uniref:Uncharacterized protein n=1 Tax=Caldimonas brevitalea TaxID=413882 RepID=A0A0G3BMX4_9BURK|nr:hypothetical protein [Caldimonas brevitalea]AKJ28751.1 hypothetical protein AAW51_2060 [Caldimonas brevitalea]